MADSGDVKPDEKPESLIAKQQALFERINLAEAWKITKGDPKGAGDGIDCVEATADFVDKIDATL